MNWQGELFMPAGKNAKLVDASVHIASSNGVVPTITSRRPQSAFGARLRDNVGLRRSQSTKMTRAPTCAMSNARLAAIVDFPSLGIDEVKPITLLAFITSPLRSTASLMARIASAKREKGESSIAQITSESRAMVLLLPPSPETLPDDNFASLAPFAIELLSLFCRLMMAQWRCKGPATRSQPAPRCRRNHSSTPATFRLPLRELVRRLLPSQESARSSDHSCHRRGGRRNNACL